MFKDVLRNTAIYGDTENSFFAGKIRGDSYLGDISFGSTLRALVYPRMDKKDEVGLYFGSTTYKATTVASTSVSKMISTICSNAPIHDANYIYIHSMRAPAQDDNYACLELLKNYLTEKYSGWERVEKITDFYRKQFYILCFINPELKSVMIFVDKLDMPKLHYIQCSMFAFLPWYFKPEDGVNELEMALIESLREKTPEKYLDCIAQIAKQYDFRSERIKKLLKGIECKYEQREMELIKNDIANIIAEISRYNAAIGEKLKIKTVKEATLLGLETKIAKGSENSDIMDYFLKNTNIKLESVSGSRVTFVASGYFSFFDEEMAKNVIDNPTSYVYYSSEGYDYSEYVPADDMKLLMYALFIEQKIKMKCCAAYKLDLVGSVTPQGSYPFSIEFKNDFMPNPHIDRYTCLGNYQRAINDLLAQRNFILAIEQCMASCKSLNFGDTAVMKVFMKTLYGINDYNNHCIELPDGKIVAPIDAIKWLKEQA